MPGSYPTHFIKPALLQNSAVTLYNAPGLGRRVVSQGPLSGLWPAHQAPLVPASLLEQAAYDREFQGKADFMSSPNLKSCGKAVEHQLRFLQASPFSFYQYASVGILRMHASPPSTGSVVENNPACYTQRAGRL